MKLIAQRNNQKKKDFNQLMERKYSEYEESLKAKAREHRKLQGHGRSDAVIQDKPIPIKLLEEFDLKDLNKEYMRDKKFKSSIDFINFHEFPQIHQDRRTYIQSLKPPTPQ